MTPVDVVVVGGGFAGVATAWALARDGVRNGVLLEREPLLGAHASGRNAGMLRQAEADPTLRRLAVRSTATIRTLDQGSQHLFRPTGGLLIASGSYVDPLRNIARGMREDNIAAELLSNQAACLRFPELDAFRFDAALLSPEDGVVDIHALLSTYAAGARQAGWTFVTGCHVEQLWLEAGHIAGVHTSTGDFRSTSVVLALGAWAGELGSLTVTPYRRHLVMSGPSSRLIRSSPFIWDIGAGYYARSESDGVLLSPCDEEAFPAGSPEVSQEALTRLASLIDTHAPGLRDLGVRRSWACLRTFAPDRRPVIGPDPHVPGLYYVAGLGGFGVTTSPCVGEMASKHVRGVA